MAGAMTPYRGGIHRFQVSIYGCDMETVFDDISSALREPRTDVWGKARVFALGFAGMLLLGVAIGLGIGIGMAIAG
ncbi:hypothetical protein ACWGS9_03260 [Bradyrhizobium sp. Arg314]